MINWQPIETAPKVDMEMMLGYDAETARAFGDPQAGAGLLTWVERDDDDEEDGWDFQPFADGLDSVISETRITHWAPLSEIGVPASLSSSEGAGR